MRRVVRRIAASDARVGGGAPGVPHGLESADVTEQRRRQRIHAAARMLNHVVARRRLDRRRRSPCSTCSTSTPPSSCRAPASSAPALAIGGQHKVNDYLTGLSVLFEDRYGVGDELRRRASAAGEPRPRRRRPHRPRHDPPARRARARCTSRTPSWTLVRNLSQEAAASTVRLRRARRRRSDADASGGRRAAQPRRVRAAHRRRVRRRPRRPADAGRRGRRRRARRCRPLDDRSRAVLVERAEHALGVPRRGQADVRVRRRRGCAPGRRAGGG